MSTPLAIGRWAAGASLVALAGFIRLPGSGRRCHNPPISMAIAPDRKIDCLGLACPMPILKTREAVKQLASGQGAGDDLRRSRLGRRHAQLVGEDGSPAPGRGAERAGVPLPHPQDLSALRVYLDYGGLAPVDPRVIAVMRPFLEGGVGNPAAAHSFGVEARAALDGSRAKIARLVGASPAGIIFTASATEANNLAVRGTAAADAGLSPRDLRHRARVRPPRLPRPRAARTPGLLRRGGRRGPRRSRVPSPRPFAPRRAWSRSAAASGEIGTIQAIREIGRLTRRRGVRLHVDGVGAVGRIPLLVDDWGIDLLSLSAQRHVWAARGRGPLGPARGSDRRPAPRGRSRGRASRGNGESPGHRGHGGRGRPAARGGPGGGRAPRRAARSPPPRHSGTRHGHADHRRPFRPSPAAPCEPDRVGGQVRRVSSWSWTSRAWRPRRAPPAPA